MLCHSSVHEHMAMFEHFAGSQRKTKLMKRYSYTSVERTVYRFSGILEFLL